MNANATDLKNWMRRTYFQRNPLATEEDFLIAMDEFVRDPQKYISTALKAMEAQLN